MLILSYFRSSQYFAGFSLFSKRHIPSRASNHPVLTKISSLLTPSSSIACAFSRLAMSALRAPCPANDGFMSAPASRNIFSASTALTTLTLPLRCNLVRVARCAGVSSEMVADWAGVGDVVAAEFLTAIDPADLLLFKRSGGDSAATSFALLNLPL